MNKQIFPIALLTAAVLVAAASCATPEPKNETPPEEPPVVEELPLPVYIQSRYSGLMNNSLYEISQPRGTRFEIQVLPAERFLTERATPAGLLVYIAGDDPRPSQLAGIIGVSERDIHNALQRRDASYLNFRHDERMYVAILGRNIDAALLAVERNSEVQELILEHLGQYFYPRE